MQINQIEQWTIFELKLTGPKEGNPFEEVSLTASFTCMEETITVQGFYDGEGVYLIRFMPDRKGKWSYSTSSNIHSLDKIQGHFLCTDATQNNHGPIHIQNQYHFAYADGNSFYPFGTTCYAWIHQSEELQEITLSTLQKSPFNKLRMCVFPKYYSNNHTEPDIFPFEAKAQGSWDFTRFCPEFFQHMEKQIGRLMEMGIEVDLILFHPYDKGHWGFDRMSREADDRYLRYVIARLSAFRNIWWSIANEYDYMEAKTKEDWERNIQVVAQLDSYHHLLSIHQGDILYDHWNPYITHASIQLGYVKDMVEAGMGQYKMLRDAYQKPVIYDEAGYEGNLIQRWGKLSGEALVDKFWKAIVSGTYLSHGETYADPEDIIWWAKGGILKGKSPERIAFLKEIVENSGLQGLEPIDKGWVLNGVGKNGKYYLFYLGNEKLEEWRFELPAFKIEVPLGTKFQVEVIDTWNMTITPIDNLFEITDRSRYKYTCRDNAKVLLPGKEHIALRIRVSNS